MEPTLRRSRRSGEVPGGRREPTDRQTSGTTSATKRSIAAVSVSGSGAGNASARWPRARPSVEETGSIGVFIYSSQSLGESDSSVWSTVRGDFHCSPDASFPCNLSDPDGYHHRLFARVAGYPSGHSGCTHSWDGHIVLGPEVEIVSGCT